MSVAEIEAAATAALTLSPTVLVVLTALVVLGGVVLLRWFAHQPKNVRADVVKLVRALLRSK